MSIRSAVVLDDLTIGPVWRIAIDNQAPERDLLDALSSAVETPSRSLPTGSGLPVAVGFPEPFDYENCIPELTHKWGSIKGVRLDREIAERCKHGFSSFRVVNDAAAAAVGQVMFSDAPTAPTLVLTIGTGLGSALVEDGEPVAERAQLRPGDLWMQTLESGEQVDDVFSARGLARLLDVAPRELAGVLSADSAPPALEEWGARLGRFIEQTANRLEAERTIIGGGIAESFAAFEAAIQRETDHPVFAAVEQVRCALVGAVSIAFPDII